MIWFFIFVAIAVIGTIATLIYLEGGFGNEPHFWVPCVAIIGMMLGVGGVLFNIAGT